MRVYVFYDSKTGKIVHEHRQPNEARARSKDDLLRLVHPSVKKSGLEMLEVDETKMKPGIAYRVDPKTRALQAAKKSVPYGRASLQHATSAH